MLAHNCSPLHVASLFGYVEVVEVLLAHGLFHSIVFLTLGADVFATNRYNCTPIHNAAYVGHFNCLKLLLSRVPTGSAVLNNSLGIFSEPSERTSDFIGNSYHDARTEALKVLVNFNSRKK